jgi:hypothetical protein
MHNFVTQHYWLRFSAFRQTEHMDADNARSLDLHDAVVWIPDGIRGEVIDKDESGITVRWQDGQAGYYQ